MTKSKIVISITLEMPEEMAEKLVEYVSKTLIYNGVRNGWFDKYRISALKELGSTETLIPGRSGHKA